MKQERVKPPLTRARLSIVIVAMLAISLCALLITLAFPGSLEWALAGFPL